MERVEKVSKIMKNVGMLVGMLGFLYLLGIAGTSDFETMENVAKEYHHSIGWYIQNAFIGMLVLSAGAGLVKLSEYLVGSDEGGELYEKIEGYKRNPYQ